MKVFSAALWNETNAFAPFPTDLGSFVEGGLFRPGERPDDRQDGAALCQQARLRARAGAFQLVEGTCAYAEPSGLIVRAAYEKLRDRILAELAQAMPLDAVALSLHGAMSADGYPDCEGDLLRRVRAQVGPGIPVGVTIDPHANLSAAMIEAADIIIAFKEYPHIDCDDRANETLDLLIATVEGRVRPVMRAWDTGALGVFHTSRPMVAAFVARMRELERSGAALSVSLIHGFPWSDTDSSGTRTLVIADGDNARADALARELAGEAAAIAPFGMEAPIPMSAAIDRAIAAAPGPTVLADSPDNPGGGAAGDSTALLAELISRGVTSACLGPLWDPGAVELAFRAGVGARLQMRVGGKAGYFSGRPVDGEAEILALDAAAVQMSRGAAIQLGRAAAIRFEGVDLVVVSHRSQALSPDLFTRLGIEPETRTIIIVKSSRHYEHGFKPIAKHLITVDCPGSLQLDLSQYPYRHLKRPRWPMDAVGSPPFPVAHVATPPMGSSQ
ncbi:MAG TPA: M81 family metallopeptidase [Verrucomicrobiae bacterium]|nr:M81 family metallopeptidase [Verrucomicrobiae bacterium]